eukprot:jgi/Hompol1/4773/HPOL_003867-RA
MILRSLCDISKSSKKKSKVQSCILKVDSILAAFGNATTPVNPNASCYARYSEIQFAQNGRMAGIKVIESLLEKSRVSGAHDGGYSFHIFYYLLNGASHDERVQWHLSDEAHFRFLTSTRMTTVGFAQTRGSAAMDELRENLRALGIGRRQQTQLWQLLAAILHLGNITFQSAAKEGDPCTVRNQPQLQLVADMLGLSAATLQTVLTSRSSFVGKSSISAMLDATSAARQRDSLARALYAVIFDWILEQINQRLCLAESEWSNFVSIVDIPGLVGINVPDNGMHRLLVNYANEQLLAHTMTEFFTIPKDAFTTQNIPFPESSPYNREILSVLSSPRIGVLPIIDQQAARNGTDQTITAKIYEANLDSSLFVSSSSKKLSYAFGIRHFSGIVEYDVRGFAHHDADVLQSDFVTMVRGNPEQPGTANVFLRSIFSNKVISTRTVGQNGGAVVSATNKGRFPSLRRRKERADDEDESLDATATIGHEFRTAFGNVIDTIAECQSWFVFHIKISDTPSGSKVDNKVVERQVAGMHLASLITNPAVIYTYIQPHADFVARYKGVVSLWERDPKAACESLCRYRNWTKNDAIVTATSIFLSETAWRSLEDRLRAKEQQDEARNAKVSAASQPATGTSNQPRSNNPSGTTTPIEELELALNNFGNDSKNRSTDSLSKSIFNPSRASLTYSGEQASVAGDSDSASNFESEFEDDVPYKNPARSSATFSGGGGGGRGGAARNTNDVELGNMPPKKEPPPVVKKRMSRSRCCWLSFTWATTFCWIPPCLSICCCMKAWDRQIAWREKVALCIIIFLMNAFILFFIVGLGFVLCPKKAQLSPGEISGLYSYGPKAAVYMYGSYYFIPDTIDFHNKYYMDNQAATPRYWESAVLGHDVSQMFPKWYGPNWQTWCPSFPQPAGFQLTDPIPTGSKWYTHVSNKNYFSTLSSARKGVVVWDTNTIADAITKNRYFLVMYDNVYEVTAFYNLALNPSQTQGFFLGSYFKTVADRNANKAGVDSTSLFDYLKSQDPTTYNNVMSCLNGMFYVGKVDHRNDLQCVVPNYVLLAASAVLVALIGFKFLAALQFSSARQPEDPDKFVICQVPCYTEGEVSLRRTIDSLSNLIYDDKHKLLFIICDGMIIGSGNDRPTPRIVLDILGVDPSVDPEALPYQSLGDGNAQLNYAKVYSGLYEINGHVVPFIVVVKVGKPSERVKPGNRGKRDSQLILMRYLSRVHFNQPMTPLELELFHQMKNVIGIDPSFYEFVFMVDADTQVTTGSLNLLVSHMTRDLRIAGSCGETTIANERKSFTSMIQVYEYFISHHLAKAFESLFGSVTCLPGCFSIYRIRTSKNTPVLVAPGLVSDYSENNVDTLHRKNLLHLGEDRYLTTLLLKYFPHMKTTFTPDAKCQTYAPDQWSVLLSQRRRWINSTVHNLFELLKLRELCGFCCFSMRFVVFVDLLATFIQPSALIYIGYLVYAAVTDTSTSFPLISIIMVACVYGFQIFIFLLRTEWQHIGWMIMYLLAIPLFSFYIPIYAFWHFDDFSWGNTRMIMDEGKGGPVEKKVAEQDWFDPDSVPLMKWVEYDAQRKPGSSDKDDTRSLPSYRSGGPLDAQSNYGGSFYERSAAGSVYGGGSVGGAASRPPQIQTQADPSGMLSLPRSLVSVGSTNAGILQPAAPAAVATAVALGVGSQGRQHAGGFPTDEEILREVRHILATTDLMKVTKKSVREQLSKKV